VAAPPTVESQPQTPAIAIGPVPPPNPWDHPPCPPCYVVPDSTVQ